MTTKVKFNLPAICVAGAERGLLLGEFNNWNVEEGIWLERNEDGSMVAELALAPGKTYEYRYLLSDGRWVNDENTKASTEFGQITVNCVIDVPMPEAKVKVKRVAVAKLKTTKKAEPIADDLTKIDGINKKVASLLLSNEISDFKTLGKSSIKKLQLILDGAGSKFNVHNPASWPKQAKLAAAGKWDELSRFQKEAGK